MEARDMMESAIWGCASLGCQDMDVGMEIDAISESLDYRHHSWHELMACDGPKREVLYSLPSRSVFVILGYNF